MLCQKVALISNLMLHYRDKQAFGCPVWGYTGSLALVPVVSTWLPVAWRDPIRGWTLHKHEQLIIYNLQYIWHIYIYISVIYIYIIYICQIYIYMTYSDIYLTYGTKPDHIWHPQGSSRCKHPMSFFGAHRAVPSWTRRRSRRTALRGAGSPGSSDWSGSYEYL